MKRSFLFSSAVLGVLLTACSLNGSVGTDGGAASSAASSEALAVSSPASEARVVRVEVANWAFTPSLVTPKVGEQVKVEFVGVSGNHGIGVPDLGIDVKLDEGQTAVVDLPTDKAGTFPFRCNVMCGEGHREMKGTIVIE